MPNVLIPRTTWLFHLLLTLAAACCVAFSSAALANPVPITLTEASAPTFGSPISISWSLKNSTTTPWKGSFVFNLDTNAVSPLDQPNNISIAAGGVHSGTFTFPNPGPGVHWLSVTFIDTVSVGDGSTTHIPMQIIPGQPPKPTPPPAKPSGPTIAVLATGALKFDGSQLAPPLPSGPLTDQQKNTLLQLYAPLLLFSYDHESQERYAPIDVLDFVNASSLVSQVPGIPSQSHPSVQTLTNTPLSVASYANAPGSLPLKVFIAPSQQAQFGTPWDQVMSSAQNGHPVGLYGHVTLETIATVNDNVPVPKPPPLNPIPTNPIIQQELASDYSCAPSACTAPIIKIEYWQFFGYSHDFENPAGPFSNVFGPNTSNILADILDHGGDWCTVQLYVDARWAFSSHPERAILAVYHSAHGVQFGFDMGQASPGAAPMFVEGFAINQIEGPNFGRSVTMNVKAGETDNAVQAAQNNVVQFAKDPTTNLFVHPVVYVEWGGHEFYPTSAWDYKDAAKHNGTGKYHYIASGVRNIGEVGSPTAGYDQANLITNFAGYWGYYGPANDNGPPQGPILHKQWFWTPNSTYSGMRSQIKMPF